MMCAIEWMARWTAPWQKSIFWVGFLSWTVLMTTSSRSEMPSPLAAEIGMTGMPSCSESFLMWMLLPLARTSSIIFSARIIGMFSSISCRVR